MFVIQSEFMRKLSPFIILISVVLVSSCKKENNPPANIISEFPNEVGDHWRYLYTWGIATVHLDTIDVDIVGTRTITGGQTAKVWAYKYKFNNYPMVHDTGYVIVDSQLVKIYLYAYGSYYERKRYKLPVTVGDIWTIPQNYKDTTWVLGNHAVTVPAGTFPNTYALRQERKYIVNSWTNNDIYLSPQVGLVKFDQSEYSLGDVLGNGLWELISYTVQ
jgi:hypothetical protein